MLFAKNCVIRSATAAVVLAFIATPTFLSFNEVLAQEEQFEKCYGISEIAKNDGWGKDLNPGKYKSEQDFDGKAWKFVEKDTCLKLGGQLEEFEGTGTPTPPEN